MEWLLTIPDEREPRTQKDLADELGISTNTLNTWKNAADFLADWERRYRKTVGSPEKAQQVLQALHATAIDRTDPRQVQAARAYMEQIEGARPQKLDVTVTNGKAAKDLSDEELFAMLADRAEKELADRLDDRTDVDD